MTNLKETNSNREQNQSTMMYIHGFLSGANGSKREQLQKYFEGRYRVIAPEVDADPEISLAKINEIIALEKPRIIIGTSLGGWMALMCDSGEADLFVVNPCVDPKQTLSQWKGELLSYFCQRLDGVQSYMLTQDVLDKYDQYDLTKVISDKYIYVNALCSINDELLKDTHIRMLRSLLPAERLFVVGDFGHRCSGMGMKHLYKIIESSVFSR